jgi:CubicO group peptidase (beta-lactamase class C family)
MPPVSANIGSLALRRLSASLLSASLSWSAIADEAPGASAVAAASGGTPEPAVSEITDGRTHVSPALRQLRDALAPLIADAQARFGIPALSLVLVRGEETLWAEGFGLADPEKGVPATAQTRYRAGSLAKPLTALAVLGLAARGALDIDQPLSGALPGFRLRERFDSTARPITVRSVLSHHSGLPSDLNRGLWSGESFTEVRDRLRDEYAAYPPNLVFNYSNVGYSLLGHLIQTVSGGPYAEYMDEQLLTPLGMRASALTGRADGRAATRQTAPALAFGHRNSRRFEALPLRDVPAQGLVTSAADLGRLMSALLCGGALNGRQVLEPSVIEAAFQPQNAEIALDMDIVTGLGVFLEDGSIPGAGRVVRHAGNTLAYTAELVLLPEQGLGMAVLASAGGAGGVLNQLTESVLSRTLKTMPEPLPADLFIAATGPRADSGRPLDPDGRYATDLGLISINMEQDWLCACMTGERAKLIPFPDGSLGMDTETSGGASPTLRRLAQLRLQTRRIGEREVIVARTDRGESVLGEKVPPQAPPQAWLAGLGHWRVLNPDPGFPVEDLTLKLTDGQLCMSYRMPVLTPDRIQVPVRATSEDTGIILGLGRSRGDAVRIFQDDSGPRLRWSGYVAEPVARVKEHDGNTDSGR